MFFFPPFPRLALNRYQLPFSWHRWLKTASAYGPRARRAWRVSNPRTLDDSACSIKPLLPLPPSSYRSWMEDACRAMGDQPD